MPENDIKQSKNSGSGIPVCENKAKCEKRPSLVSRLFRKVRRFVYYGRRFGWRTAYSRFRQGKNEREYAQSISCDISREQRASESSHSFSENPKISVCTPLYNTPEQFLREMIDSVLAQTYSNFELVLADGSDAGHSHVGEVALQYAERDSRIVYLRLSENLGISENTNAATAASSGAYIALLDHDDILHPSALYEAVCKISDGADFVYTDEAVFESPDIGNITFVHHKPDFAPDNLLGNNYICHLSVFSRKLYNSCGGFRREFDGSQDHDLVLRLTEKAEKVEHVDKILYFWRSHSASVAKSISTKGYAVDAGIRAVSEAIASRGMSASVESSEPSPTIYRLRYEYPKDKSVSVIIYGDCGKRVIKKCLRSLIKNTEYPNLEFIVASSREYHEDEFKPARQISISGLNTAELLNRAVSLATGEYLAFVYAGTSRFSRGWLAELMMYAQREDIAAAAGTVYYRDGSIRHSGFAMCDRPRRILHRSYSIARLRRWHSSNLSAVSAEMMLTRREVFSSLGGFDSEFAPFLFDVDYCLRARLAGSLIVWTPYAESMLHARPCNGIPSAEAVKRLSEKHGEDFFGYEPYYNSNYSRDKCDYSF